MKKLRPVVVVAAFETEPTESFDNHKKWRMSL
jgi:hypothetical protein